MPQMEKLKPTYTMKIMDLFKLLTWHTYHLPYYYHKTIRTFTNLLPCAYVYPYYHRIAIPYYHTFTMRTYLSYKGAMSADEYKKLMRKLLTKNKLLFSKFSQRSGQTVNMTHYRIINILNCFNCFVEFENMSML